MVQAARAAVQEGCTGSTGSRGSGAGGMRSETHGFCLLSGYRNQVGNSDFKAQTCTSLSPLVLCGGGGRLEMWHDPSSAQFAKLFNCHDSLSAATCKSSCRLAPRQRGSNGKQDTMLIQASGHFGRESSWVCDLSPVRSIKWHICP